MLPPFAFAHASLTDTPEIAVVAPGATVSDAGTATARSFGVPAVPVLPVLVLLVPVLPVPVVPVPVVPVLPVLRGREEAIEAARSSNGASE